MQTKFHYDQAHEQSNKIIKSISGPIVQVMTL